MLLSPLHCVRVEEVPFTQNPFHLLNTPLCPSLCNVCLLMTYTRWAYVSTSHKLCWHLAGIIYLFLILSSTFSNIIAKLILVSLQTRSFDFSTVIIVTRLFCNSNQQQQLQKIIPLRRTTSGMNCTATLKKKQNLRSWSIHVILVTFN